MAIVLGGCAGGEPGTTTIRDRVLTADPATIQISPGEVGPARFILTSGHAPVAGQTVSFIIIDNPGIPDVEAQGATLAAGSAVTDVSGVATVEVRAGLRTVFRIRAMSGSAQAELEVLVVDGAVGSVVVAPFFAPGSTAGTNQTSIGGIELRFFDDTRCGDHALAHPMMPVRLIINIPATGGTARFDNISPMQPSVVIGRALGERGTPVAIGCVDIPGASVQPNGVVEVGLPLHDAVPDPIGVFALTSTLDFKPPLAAAAVVDTAWRDLSDCPLDPAQLLLDCMIDALSQSTPGDPHDCRPSTLTLGEGPLGDKLRARRGEEIIDAALAGTGCRGPLDARRATSLDAVVTAMFGSPLPPLIASLPAIAADAAQALEAPTLTSTLDIRASAEADHYLVAHTLTGARFALTGGAADVSLAPLALPNLTAYTTAITRDGLLIIDRHGFSLRLGRVARAGFGAAALEPRGSPATASGLVATIAGLATTDGGATSGCAALDRVLCADVAEAPGCLAAACPAGLSALAAVLDVAFAAADGPGLDFYLSGSTPLVDQASEGWADVLDASLANPAGVAAWSVDLRTSQGVARITTKFRGVRTAH